MDKIKNGYSLDMSKIVNQLRVKAAVMEMGEHIAWGSDTALMREAADRIETLEEALRDIENMQYGLYEVCVAAKIASEALGAI